MKQYDDNKSLTHIIEQGTRHVPSPEFNQVVLAHCASECRQVMLKPSLTYTLLIILDVIILIGSWLGLYLYWSNKKIITHLADVAIGPQEIAITVIAVVVFSLFLVFADICEEKGLLPTS